MISKNGEEILNASGNYAGSIQGETIDVAVGDTITVTYVKDGSVSVGRDMVMITDVVYLATE